MPTLRRVAELAATGCGVGFWPLQRKGTAGLAAATFSLLVEQRQTLKEAKMGEEVLSLPPEVLKLTHQLEQEKYESLNRRYEVGP